MRDRLAHSRPFERLWTARKIKARAHSGAYHLVCTSKICGRAQNWRGRRKVRRYLLRDESDRRVDGRARNPRCVHGPR